LPAVTFSLCRLSSNGIFLLENGHDLFMWIGRAVNPAIISTLFGLNTLEGADMQALRINPENSDFSSRVDAVVNALRLDRSRYVVVVETGTFAFVVRNLRAHLFVWIDQCWSFLAMHAVARSGTQLSVFVVSLRVVPRCFT
jgi:hypothetical protein